MRNITEIGKFRLMPIIKIDDGENEEKFIEMPVSYGLNLEAKTKEGYFIVIATLRSEKEGVGMETIESRFMDAIQTTEDWRTACTLLKIGTALIKNSFPEEDY